MTADAGEPVPPPGPGGQDEGAAAEDAPREDAAPENALQPDAPQPEAGGGPAAHVRDDARRAIEAIVLVSETPIDVNLLGQLLELRPAIVDELCRELAAEYDQQGRGFQLARVAGGWRYQSHPEQAPYVERFVLEGQTAKLSAAALETLAIVAYKQPISRAQVASIRGVSVDGVMRTLHQRGYIAEVGRDPGPGQAVMYGTTAAFLEKVGADSLVDLPALGDFVPGADVVEQLERGLRPDAPSLSERLEQLEATNAARDTAGKAPDALQGPDSGEGRDGGGGVQIDLDRALGVDDDDPLGGAGARADDGPGGDLDAGPGHDGPRSHDGLDDGLDDGG